MGVGTISTIVQIHNYTGTISRAFLVVVLQLWNVLLGEAHDGPMLVAFKCSLKSLPFCSSGVLLFYVACYHF